MPLNLSALVRYKTINNCLSSIRKYTIRELVDRCSEAISDYKGELTSVSERTVREDIKNMRSDILGFNAPIEQNHGLYYYADRKYDFMNVLIKEEGLVQEIFFMLLDLGDEIHHPKLKGIMKQLEKLLHIEDECCSMNEMDFDIRADSMEKIQHIESEAEEKHSKTKKIKKEIKTMKEFMPDVKTDYLRSPSKTSKSKKSLRLKEVYELLGMFKEK